MKQLYRRIFIFIHIQRNAKRPFTMLIWIFWRHWALYNRFNSKMSFSYFVLGPIEYCETVITKICAVIAYLRIVTLLVNSHASRWHKTTQKFFNVWCWRFFKSKFESLIWSKMNFNLFLFYFEWNRFEILENIIFH